MSIRSTIQRLMEVKFGDPAELERLYGKDFTASGHLSASQHDEDVDVPAFVRDKLSHHGYQLVKSSPWEKGATAHLYSHHDGVEVHAMTGPHATGHTFSWYHCPVDDISSGVHGYSGNDLVKRLDWYHS